MSVILVYFRMPTSVNGVISFFTWPWFDTAVIACFREVHVMRTEDLPDLVSIEHHRSPPLSQAFKANLPLKALDYIHGNIRTFTRGWPIFCISRISLTFPFRKDFWFYPSQCDFLHSKLYIQWHLKITLGRLYTFHRILYRIFYSLQVTSSW